MRMSANTTFPDDTDIAAKAIASAFGRRWRVVQQERTAGGKSFAYNPGQDMAELRAMAAGAAGDPALRGALVRLGLAMQGEMLAAAGLDAVYVAGGQMDKAVEGARGYFGFGVRIKPVSDIREALEASLRSPAILACLPWPEVSGAGQWWPMLNEQRFRPLVIAGGWPSLDAAEDTPPRMAIVGQANLSPSGRDEMVATVHDDRVVAEKYLRDAGLEAEVTMRARSLALLRIKEFVAQDDPRIATAIQAGLDGLRIIGSLPRP